jgi:uncharacterized membrane protein YphA (DoxX/SURF4 family)
METSMKTVRQVQTLLKFSYGIIPVVAGLDKFTNLLTDWKHYLAPSLEGMLPFSGETFMIVVGIIEIIAGIVVFIRPQLGAYVVAAWLVLIALILLAGGYPDVAVRDLAMAIGAFSLARLSAIPALKTAD